MRPVIIAAMLTLAGGIAREARADDWDDVEEPDEDWQWEDGNDLEDGSVEDGFYRPRERAGYAWVPGHYEGGLWVPGDYRPVAVRADEEWEPGFRGPDGYFVMGFYRPRARAGWVWVPRSHGSHGYWRPAAVRNDVVWVDGYWTPDGRWVDGTWRDRGRVGYVWVPGHWRWGRWIPGQWVPSSRKANQVWVAGTWGPHGWADGYWRPRANPGHYWRGGHWHDGVWVQGAWVNGRYVGPVHRHKPVRTMMHERAKHRQYWRAGQRADRREDRRDRREDRRDRREDRRDRREDRRDRHEDRRDKHHH